MEQLNFFTHGTMHHSKQNTGHLTKLRENGKFQKGNPAPLYNLLNNCKIEFASEKWPQAKQTQCKK